MSAALLVLDCGAATSLQDGGRRGYLRYGLSGSGPTDRLALAAANVLVGNRLDAAAIEFGMGGGRFRAEGGSVRLALAGAPSAMRVDDEPVASHRSLVLREGSELRIDRPREGAFAYLAVTGGFAVQPVMGSVSLHLRGALGGVDGRTLRAEDRLSITPRSGPRFAEKNDATSKDSQQASVRGPANAFSGLADLAPSGERDVMLDPVPLERDAAIRVVLGPQEDRFTTAGLDTLLGATFTVSNRADRMGYQLDGPEIAHRDGFNIVSDATVAGSIQVPGSGRPIVLLADRQTTGGYPKIATVISPDLRRIAQRRPGEALRFEAVDVETAVRLARERAAVIAGLPSAVRPAMDVLERLFAANVAGDAVDALSGG